MVSILIITFMTSDCVHKGLLRACFVGGLFSCRANMAFVPVRRGRARRSESGRGRGSGRPFASSGQSPSRPDGSPQRALSSSALDLSSPSISSLASAISPPSTRAGRASTVNQVRNALPRFLQPLLQMLQEGASVTICSGCQLTSKQIKWKYPNGRGCACWCCGNASVAVCSEEEDTDEPKTWTDVVQHLHSFKGLIFAKFYISLDSALITYHRGGQRHRFSNGTLTLPQEPCRRTLSGLAAMLADAGDVRFLQIPIHDYVRAF